MPRKFRSAKRRMTLTPSDLAARAKWGGILPWVPELSDAQRAEWYAHVRAYGLEPSGDDNLDVARYREANNSQREQSQ